MIKIKPQLQKLINERFNDSQKEEVKEMLLYEKDRFIINYTILNIALKDDLVILNNEELIKFYNVDDRNLLNVADVLIAKVIITLSNKLNIDVKSEFEKRFTLDKRQPELTYLINLIDEEYYK